MKFYLDCEEWYPVIKLRVKKLSSGYYPEKEIDIPDELWERYKTSMLEFYNVQCELAGYDEDISDLAKLWRSPLEDGT